MRATLAIAGGGAALLLAAAVWLFAAAASAPPAGTAPADAASRPTTGAEPGAPAVDGSEVLPPDDASTPTDRLPERAPAAPLLTVPLPASGTAEGSLIDGFPTAIAAPADGSDVIDSAVATEDHVMQFSLRARTDEAAADVLAHYRELWTALGLAPVDGGDGESAAYRDAHSSVTVVARSSGTGVVYTIYGVLRAA